MIELGKIIQEKRISESLTVEDISTKIKIKKEYIIAIENGEIDSFASEAYYYGFLKQYMKLLNINSNLITNKIIDHKNTLINRNPLETEFKPSLLFIIIVSIISVIIYDVSSNFISHNTIDPIALEINQHISQLVQK